MLRNYKFSTNVMLVVVYIILFSLLIITIVPIWMLLVNATRSTVEIQQGLAFLPSTHLLENYQILEGRGIEIFQGFRNSLFLAAYGVVVYDFKGKNIFYSFIILLVLIPTQLSIIGFYQFMSRLGLTDNYASLILPGVASAFAVFFGKQYFESVVIKELIDAPIVEKIIDGLYYIFPKSWKMLPGLMAPVN